MCIIQVTAGCELLLLLFMHIGFPGFVASHFEGSFQTVNFWALQIEEMPKLINCESKFFKIKTMQYVNCQTVQLEKHCLIAQVSFIKYGNDSW